MVGPYFELSGTYFSPNDLPHVAPAPGGSRGINFRAGPPWATLGGILHVHQKDPSGKLVCPVITGLNPHFGWFNHLF